MSVSPKSGKGTVLKIGDGASPEVFTTIPGCRDFDGPDLGGRDEYDATSHSSSAKEYVVGLLDHGELTFQLVYDSTDTQQQALETAAGAGTLKNFQMVLTDTGAAQYDFAAYVKQFKLNTPVQDVIVVDVSLRITNAIAIS